MPNRFRCPGGLFIRVALSSLALLASAAGALGQVRLTQWNITNYLSGRNAEFSVATYGSFEGRSMSPDIIVAQEVRGATGRQNFLNLLNTASGSPGDWAAAPHVNNGGDTDNGLFYRASKVVWLDTTTLSQNTGTGGNQAPRDNQRYHVRLVGYTGTGAELYLYASHMKAGSTGADQARRNPEANRLRLDANALPDDANFILCGDLNIQDAAQTAYQTLTIFDAGATGQPIADGTGRFFDPINTPGDWNNDSAFRFVHTQDPATSSPNGMDDRFDMVLVSGPLRDGNGLAYIGSPTARYSTTTWNDPNHSLRVWGNDGTSFNNMLRTTGNTMVGPDIAQALITTADGLGHLPVFIDLLVPARAGVPASIDFGTVQQGQQATRSLSVVNAADAARFSRTGDSAGMDDLDYSMAASAGFSIPAGAFSEPAGGPPSGNTHVLSMDTSTLGPRSGTLQVLSDDPDAPVRIIQLTGTVVLPPPQTGACCLPNYTCNVVSAAACASSGGTFLGNGTSCASCPPEPTGACCLPGFSCSVLTAPACAGAGGTYNGNGTLCTSCPVAPVGACCFPNRACSILTQSACEAQGGTYRGNNVACTAQPQVFCTPRGACCLPGGACSIVRESTCTQLGGVYRGDDTQCSAEICIIPNPVGACCLGRCDCTVVEQAECDSLGGLYRGDNTDCATAAPCTPACPCDWNGADGLDSQDFFDFLEGFFSGDADFNCFDGTDSQDYFDYLECFFGACP